MDKYFHTTLYNGYNFFSMLELKSIYVKKTEDPEDIMHHNEIWCPKEFI